MANNTSDINRCLCYKLALTPLFCCGRERKKNVISYCEFFRCAGDGTGGESIYGGHFPGKCVCVCVCV